MKYKQFFGVAVLLLAAVGTVHAQSNDLSSSGVLLDRVAAVVNDGLVLRSEVEKQMAAVSARIQQSGRLLHFDFFGTIWELEPKTAFYDWLYINTLAKNPELMDEAGLYDAFTDIEFNPEKSLNCQARSAALYVSLRREGLLEEAMSGRETYLRLLACGAGEKAQQSLF